MEIIIEGNTCMKCGMSLGGETRKTMHHALPQHLKPVNNVKVPLCDTCHDIITSMDMGALTQFAYRIAKEHQETGRKIDKLIKHLRTE